MHGAKRISRGRIDKFNGQGAILAILRREVGTYATVAGRPGNDQARADEREIAIGEGAGDDGLRSNIAVGVKVVCVRWVSEGQSRGLIGT